MSSSLSALYPELQLTVAVALGPDLTGLREDDILPRYDDIGLFYPSRDRQIRDRERESRRNLISWSCTCRHFRSLLAPFLFRTVILRNEEKSAASIKAIATRLEYVKLVKEVQFIGSALGDVHRGWDDDEFGEAEGILPENVRDILVHLKRFPNLKSVSVEFDFDFDDELEWDGEDVYAVAEVEDMEEMREREATEAWRALMVKVWEAISENKEGVIEKLVSQTSWIIPMRSFHSQI